MTLRLAQISEIERSDHYYLEEGHNVYFLGEYTSGKSWDYSNTNQLIRNFKKGMDRQGKGDWPYKAQAINQVGNFYANAWDWSRLVNEYRVALIPIPPSKARSNSLYDARMMQVLQGIQQRKLDLEIDIRDCLSFDGSLQASHESGNRPSIEELSRALVVDLVAAKVNQQPGVVFLFDDVLTTGAHFVAVATRIGQLFPNVPIVGNFIARRCFPNPCED